MKLLFWTKIILKHNYKTTWLFIALTVLNLSVAAAGSGIPEGAPFYEEQLIFDQTRGRPQCHASTMTELPDGDILASWFAGSYEKATDVAILSSRFSLQTNTWAVPEILNDAPGLSEGNPVLFTGPGGRVWFFYLVMYGDTWNDCKIHYRISEDGGRAWGPENTLISTKGFALRNRPIILDNGTFLVPAANEMLYTPLFILTKNDFKSIKKTGTNLRDEGGLDQPTVVQLSDGSVLALFRSTQAKAMIMKSVSTDRGLTWSAPEPTEFPNPEAGIAMARLSNGRLVLVYNDSPRTRSPLTVAMSADDGKTWPWKRNIETDPFEFSYPCVIQSGDGLIHVSYTYKRTHIKHVVFNEEWITRQSADTEQ
jgi:predicted neuraminidase